jgi:RNA polymerase sigma factor (sigma-70 family)
MGGVIHRDRMIIVLTERPRGLAETAGTSDAVLIADSLTDPRSFAVIFDRHAETIFRYVSARLGPALPRTSWRRRSWQRFRRRSHYDTSRPDARPWLYGIAVREIGKHRRAEIMQWRILEAVPAELPIQDFGDRCAERIAAQQLRPRLVSVLSALPRQDLDLLLVTWAELSYAEAAEALGISQSAVRSLLNRIRARLRKALGGAAGPARR